MRALVLLSLTLFLGARPVFAGAERFEVEKLGEVQVDVPSGWITLQKRLRAPLLLAAPMPDGEKFRAIVTLYPIEGLDAEKVSDAIGDGEDAYRKAKEDWVKANDGKVDEFRKLSTESWTHVKDVQRYGVTYELSDKRFEESSYYFRCQGKPVHAKMLIPVGKQTDADREAAEGALRSISCDE